jgi:hypothetical protein
MGKRTAAQKAADREVTQRKQQAKNNRKEKWERKGLARQLRRETVAASLYGLTTGNGFQCSHVGEDGQRCGAPALTGGYYCRGHVKK